MPRSQIPKAVKVQINSHYDKRKLGLGSGLISHMCCAPQDISVYENHDIQWNASDLTDYDFYDQGGVNGGSIHAGTGAGSRMMNMNQGQQRSTEKQSTLQASNDKYIINRAQINNARLLWEEQNSTVGERLDNRRVKPRPKPRRSSTKERERYYVEEDIETVVRCYDGDGEDDDLTNIADRTIVEVRASCVMSHSETASQRLGVKGTLETASLSDDCSSSDDDDDDGKGEEDDIKSFETAANAYDSYYDPNEIFATVMEEDEFFDANED